jgi:glycosyltransferase involved in cell wall biosynthesis
VRPRPPAICFVVAGLDDLTDDDDAAMSLALAHRLAARGWQTHVLWCRREEPTAARRLHAAGICSSCLDAGANPPEFDVSSLQGADIAEQSERVRLALQRLHGQKGFDLIEFPARNGLAFRSLQAKGAGLAFDDVALVVRLGTCGPWLRECEQRWPTGPEDLVADFAEGYAIDHADVQVIAPRARAGLARDLGWTLRPDALVEPEANTPGDGAWLARPYEQLVRRRRRRAVAAEVPERALVSLCVAHYNLGRHLPETLAAVAAQTYPDLEVHVLDDGSTDAHSLEVFEAMRLRYPHFRFARQTNAGIGGTRNRGLREARGDYFIPMDADNIARPDMVERFVGAMRRNPDVAALTCYFLAFEDSQRLGHGQFAYAYRPTGGPHVLASIRNVYGDGNAIFRTAAFRAVGGYETDRDTSWEDWEAFVKLVNAGYRVEVVPDHLFYYRHLQNGFSRRTDQYANRRRVLRQFFQSGPLPAAERVALWSALAGFQRRLEELADERRCLRYQLADRLHAWCAGAPFVARCLKWLLRSSGPLWGRPDRKAG